MLNFGFSTVKSHIALEGGMSALLIISLVVAICLVILYYLRPKESFIDFGPQVSFASKYGQYANDTATKGVFINPGVNLYGLNDAIKQTDTYLASSQDRDYTTFFTPDPENAYSAQDAAFCKGASYPLDLPKREQYSNVACGWWFHPTDKSVGVLGTVDGPIFTTGLPAGGTFYWNLDTAAMKEDFKMCKTIKDCDLLNTDGIKGKCGWCGRLGHGIPITSSGAEKYPDTTDEDACGEDVIPDAGKCPQPEPADTVTSNGKSCGQYGRPSADNSIRIYTQDECTNTFQGNWYSNGECLNQEGGSYSAECASLNLPRTIVAPSVTVCTPNSAGVLSRECLIQTILSLGYTKQGSIYKMLYTTNAPTENDTLAMKYLQSAGITVPQALLGAGNIDRQSAANIYMQIYNAITKGNTEAVRQSAKLLCVGTADFDFCMNDANSTGPFDVTCTQRAFRSAGCQPAGSDYPSASNIGALATMTWAQVNQKFMDLRTATGDSDPDTQDDAMKRCFGISYSRLPRPTCSDSGMEHLMYSFDWNEVLHHTDGKHYLALVGMNRNKDGFRQIDVGGGVVPDTGDRYDQIRMKARAFIDSPQPVSGQLDCWTDDGLRVLVNNNLVINAWYDQAPTYHAASVNIAANTPTPFEINWYEMYGGATLIMRNVITKLNPVMKLPFPIKSPMVAFDFFRGGLNDIHNAVRIQNNGVSIQTRGGRSCANFSNKNYIQILNPLRSKMCKTFTCMIWWDGAPHDYQASFSMCTDDHVSDTNTCHSIRLNHSEQQTGAMWQLNYWYNVSATAANNTNPVGKWVHYAIQWTPLGFGFTLFVNGQQVATKDDPYLNAWGTGKYVPSTPFPDEIMRYMYLGHLPPIKGMSSKNDSWREGPQADFDQQMNMAWFHIYDYALTIPEIKDEMEYWNKADYAKAPLVPPYIGYEDGYWVF